jgi:hypothetical protein
MTPHESVESYEQRGDVEDDLRTGRVVRMEPHHDNHVVDPFEDVYQPGPDTVFDPDYDEDAGLDPLG